MLIKFHRKVLRITILLYRSPTVCKLVKDEFLEPDTKMKVMKGVSAEYIDTTWSYVTSVYHKSTANSNLVFSKKIIAKATKFISGLLSTKTYF